MLFIEYDCSNE